jgi:glycosyltransferase 2 family protein
MTRLIKGLVLLLGAGLVGGLVWQADPARIWILVKSLGPWAPVVLLPYGLVYLLDTLGWRLAFGQSWPRGLSLFHLARIRWAGEAVNNLVPSGYLGGEGVKVYLLHRSGVSGVTATTSVVVSKTIQILAQVLFIGLGAGLGALHLPHGSPVCRAMWLTAGAAMGILILLLGLQYWGLFRALSHLASWWHPLGLRLARHEARLRQGDASVRAFYQCEPRAFLLSAIVYFLGWLGDTVEIWIVSAWLGWGIPWSHAVAMEAFIGVAKALGTFVPASLGVQESGVVLLFRTFGLTSAEALAYALVRRARELIYALVGLGLLWLQEHSLQRLKLVIGDTQKKTT